jgi:hypothetical protein
MQDQPSDQRRYHRQRRHHRRCHGYPAEDSNPAVVVVRTVLAEEDTGPGQLGTALAAGHSNPSEDRAGSNPETRRLVAGRKDLVVEGSRLAVERKDRGCLGRGRRHKLAEAGWGRCRRRGEGTRS